MTAPFTHHALFINYEECKYLETVLRLRLMLCYSLTMRNVNFIKDAQKLQQTTVIH